MCLITDQLIPQVLKEDLIVYKILSHNIFDENVAYSRFSPNILSIT
jgi:hypothetical protein